MKLIVYHVVHFVKHVMLMILNAQAAILVVNLKIIIVF